jgi:1-acyl-sn-glycerol-3-phosphate acyltransferase
MALALAQARGISWLGWARIVLRLSAMVFWLIVCLPAYYAVRLFRRPGNPVPPMFLSGIAWIAGARIRQSGQRVRRGVFLLANHVSWLDIPVLARTSASAFVAHDGLAAVPLLKWLCEMNETVFVARHDRASVGQQIADVRAAVRHGGALTLFPEGTTSDGTGLLPFKSSLISALEPVPEAIAVQPVLIDYGAEAARIAWIGDEHGLDNFLKILARRRPVDVAVHFLPVLAGEAAANRKTIAAAARDALARQQAAALAG